MRTRAHSGLPLAFVLLAASASASLPPVEASPGQTRLLSEAPSSPANGPTPAESVPDTTSPDLSADGLTVAFSSDATNLVDGDTNRVADVFVRSTSSGKVRRVSVTRNGGQANGPSYSPVLNVDGTLMAFVSEATNLVPGDTNGAADVFVKNLKSGTISRVSLTSSGKQANGASYDPFISLFGDLVTFESEATNLTANDSNGLPDAFLYNRRTGRLRRIVAPDAEEEGILDGVARTASASISHDGNTLAYERLIVREGADIPLAADVFVEARWYDPCAIYNKKRKQCRARWVNNGTERIAMHPWGGRARKMLTNPVVTADGRYVAYEAWSAVTLSDTVWSQNQFCYEAEKAGVPLPTCKDRTALAENPYDVRTVYLFDPRSRAQIPVSTNAEGPMARCDSTSRTGSLGLPDPCRGCYDPAPNAYGTVVAFTCEAVNMVPGDTNDAVDVFVKDLPGRVTSRVSVSNTHGEGFGASDRPAISYEGRNVAFASNVATFVGGDSNGDSDVFLRDRHTQTSNVWPELTPPFGEKVIGLDVGDTLSFRMRAKDKNRRDVLRYGAIKTTTTEGRIGDLPDGAQINPANGEFTWTPRPEQSEVGGKYYEIVLWVGDPRGGVSFARIEVIVRDPGDTARCEITGNVCKPA